MDTRLKDNEWIILHAVWHENPIDLKSIIRYVQAHNPDVTWDYKTYHSFLRILLDKGYLKAVKDYGLPEIIIPGALKNLVLIRNTGYLNGKMFAAMKNPPDAVQTSDYMASGLLAGFSAIGIRVPQDVAVLGFDNRDFAALLNPPLSTLAQPNYEVGKQAADLLFRRMDHPDGEPEEIRIPMLLMVRKST